MDILGTFDPARIKSIAAEVLRQARDRKDFAVDRKALRVVAVDKSLTLGIAGQDSLLELRRSSLSQLCGTLDVPLRYVDRLTEAGHVDLAAAALNGILGREPKRHFVRTLDGRADAILSDRFRAIGNDAVLGVALEEAKRAGATIWDLRSSPDAFRFLAVAKHISGEVDTSRAFKARWRWEGKEGDVVNAAITIGNSETGHGSFFASPSILRGICQNFCVWADGVARIHVGRKIEANDAGEVFFSDETKSLDDRTLLSKVRDVIRSTFDPKSFQAKIDALNAATRVVLDKPVEAVAASIRAFGLPVERQEAILAELLGTGDTTQYGLAQAITAQVNPRNAGEVSDEERSLFEDAGGAILSSDARAFSRILATAPRKEEVAAA